MKIRAKHMVTILVPAVFILSIGIMMFWNFDLNTRQAREKAEDLAGKKANQIQTYLDMAMAASRNTAVVYEGLIKANLLTRDIANSILKQLLEDNPAFVGVSSGWEPNALDGNDKDWVNKAGHDSTGRFIPYWYREGNKLINVPLTDYDIPGSGDYYLIPKQTKQETITEPYLYEIVSGKDVLMTSMMSPIIVDGKFLGVVGVDIPLDTIQELNSQVKIYKTGFGSLISNKGIVVAHPDLSRIGKVNESYSGENAEKVRDAVENGKEYAGTIRSASLNTNTFVTYFPVNVEYTKTPWSYSMVIPESEIMQESNSKLVFMLIIAVCGSAVLLMLIWFILKGIKRNVKVK